MVADDHADDGRMHEDEAKMGARGKEMVHDDARVWGHGDDVDGVTMYAGDGLLDDHDDGDRRV